jgi:glycosyltransferase involved in cell wall biosynthesis
MKKIIICVYSLINGGMETYVINLANILSKKYNVSILLVSNNDDRKNELDNNIKIKRFIIGRNVYANIKNISNILNDYDIIIINNLPIINYSLKYTSNRSINISVIHSNIYSVIFDATINDKFIDKYICVSPKIKNSLWKFGIKRNKCIYVKNGVMSDNRKLNILDKDEKTLIYIGRIERRIKNIYSIIKIMNYLGEEYTINVIGDGEDKEIFIKKIRNISNINYLGSMENKHIKYYLRKASFFLQPSLIEGMSISLLEAMSEGVIPICSKLEGINTFIVSDERGRLCDNNNLKSYSKAIKDISNNTMLKHNMHINCIKYIEQNHNLENIIKTNIYKLFEKKQKYNSNIYENYKILYIKNKYLKYLSIIYLLIRRILKNINNTKIY